MFCIWRQGATFCYLISERKSVFNFRILLDDPDLWTVIEPVEI